MSNTGLILIADGDEASLLPMLDLLRIEGYECNYVHDATTVIEILTCIKFDLLIVDVNMFGDRTFEIVNWLPDIAKKLPIILVTDVSSFDSQIQTLKHSVISCHNKPICFEELLKHVQCSIKDSGFMNITSQAE